MKICYFLAIFGMMLLHESIEVQSQEKLTEHIKYENSGVFDEDDRIQETNERLLVNDVSTATYDISENVIDIPNNSTIPGPIATNFSLIKPLNNATGVNINKDKTKPNKPNKLHVNINASVKLKHDLKEVLRIKEELIHGFKDYIYIVKKGLVNDINDLVNSVNSGVYVPNVVAGPVKLLNNAHKKSSQALKRLHSVVFREKFENEDDF